MVRVKANKPQAEFLAMPHKFRSFVAGFGSGKTWCGSMGKCAHYWKHPKVNQAYLAPTYPHIRDIFFPTVEEVAFDMGLKVKIREGNKEVHFYNGRNYRGTTICRSMDNPGTIVGFKVGHALIDEFDLLPTHKADLAWKKIIARLRWNDPTVKNGIDVTTTPEGFKQTHKLFVSDPCENPALSNNYGMIQASTYENEVNLPDDYIPSLFEAYPQELIAAYLQGQFVNLTSGTVYKYYNRERHNSKEVITGKENLHIGVDFNVTKMAATIYVTRPDGLHAVEELKDVYDTPSMISIIESKWSGHRIIIYPDASGKSRKSVDASRSDISLLYNAGFEVQVNGSNPFVKDRINATNRQFELMNLRVNASKCPTVAKCFEGQVYDDNGEPDKKTGFDHQNDASTYPIANLYPINGKITEIRTLGV